MNELLLSNDDLAAHRSATKRVTNPGAHWGDKPDRHSRLGAWSPDIQIAEQVKKLSEDWRPVASGTRKLSVNAFGKSDREDERKRIDELCRSKDSSNEQWVSGHVLFFHLVPRVSRQQRTDHILKDC